MKSLFARNPAKIAVLLACFAVSVFAAKASRAGFKSTQTVLCNSAARNFQAAFGSARNSGDNTQFMRITNVFGVTTIDANNSAGLRLTCSTNDATTREALLHATADSFIFVAFNASGICTQIQAENGSLYAAKSQ